MERNCIGAKTMENEFDLPWELIVITLYKMALLFETGEYLKVHANGVHFG